MGDIVEDATMVRDRKHGTVLRIGFLNTSDELKLKAFQKTFDLVVLGDGSLCPVNMILQGLFGPQVAPREKMMQALEFMSGDKDVLIDALK